MVRPVVDLPQPDSPTRPSVSPCMDIERNTIHSMDSPNLFLNNDPLRNREMFDKIFNTQQDIVIAVMSLACLPGFDIHPTGRPMFRANSLQGGFSFQQRSMTNLQRGANGQ